MEIKERGKESIPKINQRRLRAIILQGAIDKSVKMISQFKKKNSTINISHFWEPK